MYRGWMGFLALALLIGASLLSRPTFAQPRELSPSEARRVEKLAAEAKELHADLKYDEAIEKLQEALSVYPAPWLAYSLARVYEDQVHGLGLKPFPGPEDRNIGSSDIGNLSHIMPVIHPHVPIARPGAVSIHTPEFERAARGPAGRRAVKEGAVLLALTALAVLTDPSLYAEVKREFERGKEEVPASLRS